MVQAYLTAEEARVVVHVLERGIDSVGNDDALILERVIDDLDRQYTLEGEYPITERPTLVIRRRRPEDDATDLYRVLVSYEHDVAAAVEDAVRDAIAQIKTSTHQTP